MHTITAGPIEIACKMGVTNFLAYKRPGWFGTTIFLKFMIFLIILVEHTCIYYVTLKDPRKWPLKWDNYCNTYTGDTIQ